MTGGVAVANKEDIEACSFCSQRLKEEG